MMMVAAGVLMLCSSDDLVVSVVLVDLVVSVDLLVVSLSLASGLHLAAPCLPIRPRIWWRLANADSA